MEPSIGTQLFGKFSKLAASTLAELKAKDTAELDLDEIRLKRDKLAKGLQQLEVDVEGAVRVQKDDAVADLSSRGLSNSSMKDSTFLAIDRDANKQLDEARQEYGRAIEELALLERRVRIRMVPSWSRCWYWIVGTRGLKKPLNYPKELARAATWIYENRDVAMWWRWRVLTSHNPDFKTLGLPDTIAWNIFTDLAYRNLMIPCIAPDEGEAFKINLANDEDWQRVMKPPGFFKRYVLYPLAWLCKTWSRLIFWLVSMGLTAYITAAITKAIEENKVTNLLD